jgi:hypothetical protein
MPDKYMPHLLPNGEMPCKWHGLNNSNVTTHSIFASQGSRVVYRKDGSIEYKFSCRYRCAKRCKVAQTKKAPESASRNVQQQSPEEEQTVHSNDTTEGCFYASDDTTFTFLGHDPEIVARLPANIRSNYNTVRTDRKGISVDLLNFIASLAANKMSCSSI